MPEVDPIIEATVRQAKDYVATARNAIESAAGSLDQAIARIDELNAGEPPLPGHPVVSISSPGSVVAGEIAVFRVHLDQPAEAQVTVDWRCPTSDQHGQLVFEPGTVEHTLDVQTTLECEGTFTIVLENAVGATIGQGSATCTVIPAEPEITISIADADPIEAGQVAKFPVSISRAGEVSVEWATADRSATGSLFWWPTTGVTQTIEIPTDPGGEGRTLAVHLSNPTGATILRWVAICEVRPAVPDGPDLTRGLLFELAAPITSPVDLDPFESDVVTILLVMDAEPRSVHQKLVCVEDALNVGIHPEGRPDIWCFAGSTPALYAMQAPPSIPFRKASSWLVEFPEGAITAEIDGRSASQVVPFGRRSPEGRRAALMKGFWKGVPNKDLAAGRLAYCRMWDRLLTPAEKALQAEEIAGLIEAEATPPQEPTLSIDDAEPVRPGQPARFRWTLTSPADDTVEAVVASGLAGVSPFDVSIEAGKTVGDLDLMVPSGSPPGPFTVTLSDPVGAALGRAVATGTVLPANGGGGGDGGGPTGELEPVDNRFLQVNLEAEARPRQTWLGQGYGLNATGPAIETFPQFKTHIHKLCWDSYGTNIIRILMPPGRPDLALQAYGPYVHELTRVQGHPPEWLVFTGFVWRGGSTVERLVDEIAQVAAKISPKSKWIVVFQNEPDGNPANAIVGWPGRCAEYVERGLARIRHHGLEGQLLHGGLAEWRHQAEAEREAQILKAEGLLGPGKVIQIGTHAYDKTGSKFLSDLVGDLGFGSWETGNNGSPNSIARFAAAIGMGCAGEMVHYCIVASPTPGSEPLAQALLRYGGETQPWYGARKLARELLPGSVVRRVTSDDRPPGLDAEHAKWMVRDAAKCKGWNPRQAVIFARRPDGSYFLLIVNTTHGADGPSPYTGGHFGARPTQATFYASELAGKNGTFECRRASISGSISGPQVCPMVAGKLRVKVDPGETAVMVGRIAA
jgi:hypothetical protein